MPSIPASACVSFSISLLALLAPISLSAADSNPKTSPAPSPSASPSALVYNRDIRPILAENCFACHGPDIKKRKAGLGLNTKELATVALKSGAIAVVPGRPADSEIIRRIETTDDDDHMPPASTGKHLSAAQVQTLKDWIVQGAEWQPHWSYIEPRAVEPQARLDDGKKQGPSHEGWVRNPIDAFVLDRLNRENLQPSPAADPVTLIRRLSFDIIGLPPTPQEVDAFVADTSPKAYDALVDRLLASPHYGERMASYWLDLVRYADTTGYHSDVTRNVMPFRDYVIAAFNDGMPFDQFTTEQLAGDLLPNATVAQKVASGYNRLNMTTEEGGAQPKEYENKYAADRVRNLSSVWMGATMGCCECHDHKFDPYSTKDFYCMEAFFADVQEAAIGAREPGMPVPSQAQTAALAQVDEEIAPVRAELDTAKPELAAAQVEWEKQVLDYHPPVLGAWSALGPYHAASAKEAFTTAYDPEHGIDLAASYKTGASGAEILTWVAHPEWKDGEIHTLTGDNSATYVYRTIEAKAEGTLDLSLGSDDTITVWVNGKQLLAHEVYRGVAPDQEKLTIPLAAGTNAVLMKIVNGGGGYGFYFQVAGKPAPDDILAIVNMPAETRTVVQAAAVAKHYRTLAPLLAPARAKLAELDKKKAAIDATIPRMLVASAGAPRTVRIRARGNWQDETGEIVEPTVPHFLEQLAAKAAAADGTVPRATRLDLARWLSSRSNPLTARVFVNRLWKMYFGMGLAKTLDDFGAQGEWPMHPELLDWLAVDFRDHGWDIKRAIKQMVTSSAYRQSSQAGPLRERDPDNRLIARQSRFRLDAEFVRDDALVISGLLVPTLGGPSVRPYQPAGYLMHLNFPPRDWMDDKGENQYRRGIYTFWQRTFLHPSLLAFDATTREECTAERPRSNTPQQALTLLNDPTYVEAARVFAERIVAAGGPTPASRLAWAYRQALSRTPTSAEAKIHEDLLAKDLETYRADPAAAKQLMAIGFHPLADGADVAEIAAWTAVARVILNLHETITRY